MAEKLKEFTVWANLNVQVTKEVKAKLVPAPRRKGGRR